MKTLKNLFKLLFSTEINYDYRNSLVTKYDM